VLFDVSLLSYFQQASKFPRQDRPAAVYRNSPLLGQVSEAAVTVMAPERDVL